MEIKIARHAGFCFGVRRAVDMAEKALEGGHRVYCLGSLIHNQQVIEKLEQKGLVTVRDSAEIPAGSVFLVRSHGIDPGIVEEIVARGGEILDATCPFVRRAQLVAKKFYDDGCDVVICGDPAHAEVVGINAWAGNSAKIIHNANEVKNLNFKGTVGVLSQTTQKKELLDNVVAELSKKTKKLAVENTICLDSSTKQAEVSALAKEVDLMIVIGGKNSSNTGKLVQLSEAQKTPTKHIETAGELQPEWFENVQKVGVAAGASTAQFLIDEVVDKIKEMC
ncbi:MAG: 4-hydroxy-3-methylbut-2-enyl diphosphate reductase [Candidatus Moranbacteria bacterium]|nr:4-hydroxy-3-methylbut-2-enyl diphosphate reductase [Candidatus Moranbacteria bacterium]